ncbi:MAG TPA: DUF4404 family protein [Xanthomonadales bacterium]|nr:DUF4404 family protein [Xanthomonadales bacterium]
MNESKLNDLLGKLNDELDKTDSVDPQTLELLQELQGDLQRLGSGEVPEPEYDTVLEQAQALEARFASEHPAAERFIREIMDMLAKVGI